MNITVVMIGSADNRIADSMLADSIGYEVFGSDSIRLHANHGTPLQSSNASQIPFFWAAWQNMLAKVMKYGVVMLAQVA